jgi:hypothetical protein
MWKKEGVACEEMSNISMSRKFVSKTTTIHMYCKKQVDQKKPLLM